MLPFKMVKFDPTKHQEYDDHTRNLRAYAIVPRDTPVTVTRRFHNNPRMEPWDQQLPLHDVIAKGLHESDSGTIDVRIELVDEAAFEKEHGVKILNNSSVYKYNDQWIVNVHMPYDM